MTGGKELCLTERFLFVDGFLKDSAAQAMRDDIDNHFAEPYRHKSERHEAWNYWHVPGTYTYLRTTPEKIIARDKIVAFVEQLRVFAAVNFGFATVTWPFLGLYIPGCSQALHNDTTNGRLGYVFSLTRNDRKTIGGETMVLQDRDLFRGNLDTAAAGKAMFDLIEPRFNRLSMFDDRVPHGVQRVDGAMDPLEGRFVLHGHVSEGGVVVQGGLKPDAVQVALATTITALGNASPPGVRGPFVVRMDIAPEGTVTAIRPIVDRLASSDGADLAPLRSSVLSQMGDVRFPDAPERTMVNVPLVFGLSKIQPSREKA